MARTVDLKAAISTPMITKAGPMIREGSGIRDSRQQLPQVSAIFFRHVDEGNAHAEVTIVQAYVAFGPEADAVSFHLHVKIGPGGGVGGLSFDLTPVKTAITGVDFLAVFADLSAAFALVTRSAPFLRALKPFADVIRARSCIGTSIRSRFSFFGRNPRPRLFQGHQISDAIICFLRHTFPIWLRAL